MKKADMINWLMVNKWNIAKEVAGCPSYIEKKGLQSQWNYVKKQLTYHVLKERIERIYLSWTE